MKREQAGEASETFEDALVIAYRGTRAGFTAFRILLFLFGFFLFIAFMLIAALRSFQASLPYMIISILAFALLISLSVGMRQYRRNTPERLIITDGDMLQVYDKARRSYVPVPICEIYDVEVDADYSRHSYGLNDCGTVIIKIDGGFAIFVHGVAAPDDVKSAIFKLQREAIRKDSLD